MWKDNEKMTEILNELNKREQNFPAVCPVCSKRSAHVYIHKHNEKHGGNWAWCSECKAYAHSSGNIPAQWKNLDFIDDNQLNSEPVYLNSFAIEIDNWINNTNLKPRNNSDKPIVLESNFKVKFKSDIEGVASCTVGILSIKDDFQKVTIDFIDTNGNSFRLNIQPEKVDDIVEVLS